jgi:hypothetical protein
MRIALLMLLGATSWAGESFGVWKLNPARSTHSGNLRSMTLRIEPHAGGEVFTQDTVAADGRASTFSTILYFDGKARDFRDATCLGTQASRRMDSRTVEIVRKCANGGWTRLMRRLGDAPGDLTLEITEQGPDGGRMERKLLLEHQRKNQ